MIVLEVCNVFISVYLHVYMGQCVGAFLSCLLLPHRDVCLMDCGFEVFDDMGETQPIRSSQQIILTTEMIMVIWDIK